jgi:uncharacterized protein (TIGR02117 family)
MVQKILKSIWLTFEFLFGLIALYVTYLLTAMLIPVNMDYVYSEEEIQFYVVSNGVHTDICLPVKTDVYDWSSFIAAEDFQGIQQPKYIAIGWGDKGFYLDTPTWADLKASTAIKAIFLPSETAMHITYFEETPEESSRVVKCSMDQDEYARLIDYVHASFERSGNNVDAQLIVGKGYSLKDNFYEANGSYWGFKTCNTWTNNALKVAGVTTSYHALFETGIMRWVH